MIHRHLLVHGQLVGSEGTGLGQLTQLEDLRGAVDVTNDGFHGFNMDQPRPMRN